MGTTGFKRYSRSCAACVLLLLGGCRGSAQDHDVAASRSPRSYIANTFDRYPIVGLSEIHGNRDTAAFLSLLIRHEGFSRKINDLVIEEFGNAAYQSVVDCCRCGGAGWPR